MKLFCRLLAITTLCIAIALIATGCVSDPIRDRATTAGAEAADRSRQSGRVLSCDGTTAGALVREYVDNPAGLRAAVTFCGWAPLFKEAFRD